MKLAAWICFAPALIAQTVTVTGTVTNGATHEPMAGVDVTIFDANDVHKVSTDAMGGFRIEGVKSCCRLIFDKEGFEAVGSWNLLFRSATDPEPLNLTMLPYPTLRGRVLDPERRPIPGSTVEATRLQWGQETATVRSDGSFAFEHMSPGEWVLRATPAAAQATESTELAPTYFPDASERGGAERVLLKAGANLSGYDIVVRRAPVFRLSGRVIDERGEAAAGASLEIATARTKSTANADGNFELPRVWPGSDVLKAEWRRGETVLRGFRQVAVQDRDIDDVAMRVAPPLAVSGTVELDGKPAKVEGSVSLEPVDGDGLPARADFSDSGIHFDAVYPGRYRLGIRAGTAFGHRMYLESVQLGERDILMHEFEVAPGLPPFRVVLKTGGGHVRGTVKDGLGGIVVLAPEEEALRVSTFMAVQFFSGDYFQIDNVRPGNYYVFAIRGSFNEDRMRDPAYAGLRLAGALAVRVEENHTETVSLQYVEEP